VKKAAFLEAFARLGTVTHAARAASISRKLPYQWAKTDPRFKTAFDDASEQATDALEAEARRRAVEGVEKPVLYQGKQVTVPGKDAAGNTVEVPLALREYSDTLLIVMLKMKGRFRDTMAHTDPDGRALGLTLEDAMLAGYARAQREQASAPRVSSRRPTTPAPADPYANDPSGNGGARR
jgi:hypothetical protein